MLFSKIYWNNFKSAELNHLKSLAQAKSFMEILVVMVIIVGIWFSIKPGTAMMVALFPYAYYKLKYLGSRTNFINGIFGFGAEWVLFLFLYAGYIEAMQGVPLLGTEFMVSLLSASYFFMMLHTANTVTLFLEWENERERSVL